MTITVQLRAKRVPVGGQFYAIPLREQLSGYRNWKLKYVGFTGEQCFCAAISFPSFKSWGNNQLQSYTVQVNDLIEDDGSTFWIASHAENTSITPAKLQCSKSMNIHLGRVAMIGTEIIIGVNGIDSTNTELPSTSIDSICIILEVDE